MRWGGMASLQRPYSHKRELPDVNLQWLNWWKHAYSYTTASEKEGMTRTGSCDGLLYQYMGCLPHTHHSVGHSVSDQQVTNPKFNFNLTLPLAFVTLSLKFVTRVFTCENATSITMMALRVNSTPPFSLEWWLQRIPFNPQLVSVNQSCGGG